MRDAAIKRCFGSFVIVQAIPSSKLLENFMRFTHEVRMASGSLICCKQKRDNKASRTPCMDGVADRPEASYAKAISIH